MKIITFATIMFILPMYTYAKNSKTVYMTEIIKEKNSQTFLISELAPIKQGNNFFNIDVSVIPGLSGVVRANFNLNSDNIFYFNFSMSSINIDHHKISDIDLSCDLWVTLRQVENDANVITDWVGVSYPFFQTTASSSFHKFPYDLSKADWKLLKFKRFKAINVSVNLSDYLNSINRHIYFTFDISILSGHHKKVKLKIPINLPRL